MAAASHPIDPICPFPANPHYFTYKGKPTVLITSDQHYGAVINADFDYVKFLDALARYGMNFTRIYPGAYIERDGDFVKDNNLGPRNGRQILPWARTRQTGAHEVLGGFKLDLDRWNEEYFARLRGFIQGAMERDIIVDIAFFNGMYTERWPFQALYHTNNIQGVGTCDSPHVQTLQDAALADRHEAYVRKITAEVAGFPNVLLDICDEPHVDRGRPEEYNPWISRLIEAVMDQEKALPRKHVIVQTIEPYVKGMPKDSPADFSSDPRVTATAHEYCWGITHLDTEYEHAKPMILIETNYYPDQYAGNKIDSSRVEGWEFIVGGGAAFMHLNSLYSTFNAGAEGTENDLLLGQLKSLKDFMGRFDLSVMRQDRGLVTGGVPAGAFARAISGGRRHGLYIHHSKYAGWPLPELSMGSCYEPVPGDYSVSLELQLPRGAYTAEWIEPKSGRSLRTDAFDHAGGMRTIATPHYAVDIALDLCRADERKS